MHNIRFEAIPVYELSGLPPNEKFVQLPETRMSSYPYPAFNGVICKGLKKRSDILAPIYFYYFSGNMPCFFRCQKYNDICQIFRLAHAF